MTTHESAIRTVIVDDHEMVATALRAAVHQRRGVDVVGVTTSVEAGVAMVQRCQPDVVVVDFYFSDGSSPDSFAAFRDACPTCAIVVITGWPSEQALFSVLDAGATGFLTKDQPIEELLDAVVRVAVGETVVCPQLIPALVRRSSSAAQRDMATLSDRELEVLSMLAHGDSTRTIADRLALSPNTVRNHVAKVLLKLGAHSRLEAVSEAERRGLIGPRSVGP